VLLGAAIAVCAAALLVAARTASLSRPAHHVGAAAVAQVSFDPVTKVARCADFTGLGDRPHEGHAVLFVQLPDDATMNFETELTFDSAGWLADDVVLGDADDARHFTLYLFAVTAVDDRRGLAPRAATNSLHWRLLDVIVVIRDNRPDTC
jgi:hypothetical protein